MEILWVLLIVSLASTLKGITGFGFALVAFVPLSFWYDPQVLIPVLILSNLLASGFMVFHKKEEILVNQEFRVLIIFGALFTLVGTFILSYLPSHLLIKIMGGLFLLIAMVSLLGINFTITKKKSTYKVVGAFLGLITGSLSVSGPPLALFLHASQVNNRQFREIFAWFSVITSAIALAGYAFSGLLTRQSFQLTLMFLPLLLVGSFIGKRMNQHIPGALFQKSVLWITLLSSILLLIK